MKREDLSFQDPQQNLDRDDELLLLADKKGGGEVLRFWESTVPFVVLGRTCKEEEDVDLAACLKDGIPVLRRSSGGGTVLQGPGCLNFALILAKGRHPDLASIASSYTYILTKVITALKDCGVCAEFRPICDLVVSGTEKKFSGNAQRRGKEYILHHGTILYDFDLPRVSRYLRIPPKMPDYRRERSHEDFVMNIPVEAGHFKKYFWTKWASLRDDD
jgi:lipoate---protein ligase